MKLKVKLYDIYFFLIALLKGFGLASDDVIYFFAFAVGCVALFYKLVNEKFTLRELLLMGVILMIGILNVLIGHTTAILFTAIAMCGLKNVDSRRVIKISFCARLIAFVCVIIVYALGFAENEVLLFYRNGEYIRRYMFCYGHPNMAHFMFALIILHVLYLYGEKMSFLQYLALGMLNYWFYCLTYSRTGLISVFASMILFGMSRMPGVRGVIMRGLKYTYMLLFLLTISSGLLYGKYALLNILDELLTGRLYYNNILLTEFRPSLFGASINDDVIVDNGYLSLLYEDGIFAFILISYFMIKMCGKLYRENRYQEFLLIICYLIYNITEGFMSSISVNVSLVFAGEILFETRKGNKRWRISQSLPPRTTEKSS